jgi:hypothetical protein
VNLFFFVRDEVTLSRLCSHIASVGFTISEPSSLRDIPITLPMSSGSSQSGNSTSDDGLPANFQNILEALSTKAINVVIATDDFSRIRICRNESLDSMTNHLTLAEIESAYILAILEKCSWRCKTAAKILGVDRSTVYRKMKKYGISQSKR